MAIVTRTPKQRSIPTPPVLLTATLRDFSGLWNTSDTDLNLQSKYANVLTNVERAEDGTLAVRQGYKFFADINKTRSFPASARLIARKNRFVVTAVNHGLVPGTRIRFTNVASGTYLGFTVGELSQVVTILEPFTKDTFTVQLPRFTNLEANVTVQGRVEVQPVEGNIIDLDYFFDHLIFATDKGNIGSIDDTGKVTVLWNRYVVEYQTLTEVIENVVIYITAGSSTIQVEPGETMPLQEVGDLLVLSDYPGMAGIPASEINNIHIITSINVTEEFTRYRIRVLTEATSTVENSDGDATFSNSLAWRDNTFTTHAVFNREVIFVNGIDKPVVVNFAALDPTFPTPVKFLQDPATGSNLNTPIGRYIAAGSGYVVIAGNALEPGKIFISSTNTNNTFEGDPDPNDATSMDVGKIAPTTSADITGLIFHKGLLFVTFENCIVLVKLGVFEEDVHVPEVVDVITSFGCVAHKSLFSIGERMLACDNIGVVDVSESVLGERFRPVRTSELISPHMASTLALLSVEDSNTLIWSFHDRRLSRYILFIPYKTGYRGYVYSDLPERKVQGWSLWVDMDFRIGCRSSQDRLFVAKTTKVYIIGYENDPIYSDDGADIRFIMEMPWIDFNSRLLRKKSRYITFDTIGNSTFKVEMFVDRNYADINAIRLQLADFPLTVYDDFSLPRIPELQRFFAGGDRGGYGHGINGHYGGDRRMSRQGLMSWVASFKLCKIRISGTNNKLLRFVSVSLMYQAGSIRG